MAEIEQENGEVDVMELLLKLLKNWKFILIWCGVAAVLGIVIAFSTPKVYTVSAKLAPELVSKASSAMSSLASMLGANVNMTTSDALYPELYPDIISSSPFVTDLFSVEVQYNDKQTGKLETVDYYTYLKEHTRSAWWNAVLAAPFKAVGWFVGLFREKPEPAEEGYSELNPYELTAEQSRIAKAISSNVTIDVDNKTYVMTLTVSSQSPYVSKKIADTVIEMLQEYVTDYRTQKARKDLEYYEELTAESKTDYYAAQQKYARYVDANKGVVLQSVMVEQERLQNEMRLAYQLYNSCAQQLQVCKAKVQQDTPVFVVLRPPVLPLHASKPRKMTIIVAFIFLGGCCAAAWVLWGRDWIARFKKEEEEEEQS